MDYGEEERKSKGVFGVWDGFAFDGFREAVPFCKRSAQVDELGVVAGEGEVGVKEEYAHEQSAQAQRGEKIGFALVVGEVEEGRRCLLLAFFVHDISSHYWGWKSNLGARISGFVKSPSNTVLALACSGLIDRACLYADIASSIFPCVWKRTPKIK